ncbi:unnamed protein product [Pylaiella littoralis]
MWALVQHRSTGPFTLLVLIAPQQFLTAMVRLVEGHIVADDEGGDSTDGLLSGLLRCRGGTTINFLGFRVPLYWSCVAAVFALLRFGAPGLLFVAVVAGASHFACRDDGSGESSGGRRPFARGSNIRGIGDLPRPPPSS